MYHTSPLSGISVSKNGYLASAGYDNRVILWDENTHIPVDVGFHDHLANQVCFSNNGRLLASSSSDYSARIWDIPSMNLLAVLHHDDDVEGISFSPNNQQIATASRDKKVRVFSVQGALIHELSGHEEDVLTVEWLSDTIVVSCGDDSTLRYWDIEKGTLLDTISLGGMETDTLCVTSQGQIVSGNDDGELVYFEKDGSEISRIKGHKSGIKRLVLNQKRIISLSYDRTFKIWEISEGKILHLTEGQIPNIVWPRSCAFINNDQVAFVTFGDRYAIYSIEHKKWDTAAIKPTHGINGLYPTSDGCYTVGDSGIVKFGDRVINQVPSLCNFIVSKYGVVICGGQDGAIYNALTSEVIYQHHSPLNCCQLFEFKEERYAVVGAYTGELIFLKLNERNQLVYWCSSTNHSNAIKDVIFDNGKIFTVCADTTVLVMECGKDLKLSPVLEGRHEKIVNGATAIAGQFVSISRDLTMRFWGSSPQVIKTPHKNSIKCIASDGESWLVTGDYRGTVCCYSVVDQSWHKQKISSSGISSVAYDEYQSVFLAASYDGKVHTINPNNLAKVG